MLGYSIRMPRMVGNAPMTLMGELTYVTHTFSFQRGEKKS